MKRDRGAYEVWLAIGIVVAIIVVGFGLFFGGQIFSQKTANLRGETSKRNQVEANGQFRIQAYNRFFDLCTTIQGQEATIKALTAERDDKAHPPSATRQDEISASLTALVGNRITNISDYNNSAQKSYTEGQFLSSKLPFRIDPTAKETTCTT
jgi:hypothetical protein